MKNPRLILVSSLALLALSNCDRHSEDAAKRIAELEQKNLAATDRQHELQQQLEDQKLAVERDAIERDRAKIEEDRAALEQLQGEAAAAKNEAIRTREEALVKREGKLEQFQTALEEKQDDFRQRDQKLDDRDRDLAGREALAFQQPEQSAPTGDYGTFYRMLSPYGSWFQTTDYGYVWQPVAVKDSNWRPYARGRWVCSDRGWTWVSEEPFGWATYHYGRWTLLRGHGWIWVPGVEWAPCWVSWRENDSHIGWAPLPPETLAYRGHSWDSTVDVQFHIGASCFNFVEIRNFGSPIFGHCLPVAGNVILIAQTVNITYIHIQNRQIICGGPQYRKITERIGKPLPFYRLEIDQHPRESRDPLGMRPRIQGDHLVVSAPNIDASRNERLKPERIKGGLENITVERDGQLSDEISTRYRQSREEERQIAGTEIGQPKHEEVTAKVAQNLELKIDPPPDQGAPKIIETRRTPIIPNDRQNPIETSVPPLARRDEPKPQQQLQAQDLPDAPRIAPQPDPIQAQSKVLQEKQFQADQARKQAIETQREQARALLQQQQEEARLRQQELIQRQQEAEAQHQREQARQQQMEESRREQAHQQQQEAQRQQESARQQQQAAQKQQQLKDDDDKKRGRNR